MSNSATAKTAATATKTKTTSPLVTSLFVQLNLPISYAQISLFREAVLRTIPNDDERAIFSNETVDKEGKRKNIFRYPQVQFRARKGYAVLWAVQAGVPLVEKFLQQYSRQFAWHNKPYLLQQQHFIKDNNFTIKTFNPKLRLQPVVYRLYAYLPFTNSGQTKNYTWLKENRNLPDIEKTEKLQQLMVNHLCSFIHYTGGYIDKKKIKLAILDKAPLTKVFFNDIEYAAFDIRYTVNLTLPDYLGLGNICSHGFGWQRLEKD